MRQATNIYTYVAKRLLFKEVEYFNKRTEKKLRCRQGMDRISSSMKRKLNRKKAGR